MLSLLCRPGVAQSARGGDSLQAHSLGARSIELWAGYSARSTSAGVLGRHAGISLGMAGLRYNHRIRAADTGFVYYTFELIPMATVTPLIVYQGDAVIKCQAPKYDCRRITAIARGFGISPFGFTAIYHADRRVQWRLGANAGALVFDRETPSDLAAKFNYTAAVEGGMQVVTTGGMGLTVVYRLHHLSNAGQAEDNLAMLSHVISVGGRWRFSR